MNRLKYLLLSIIVVFVFVFFRHQDIFSANENDSYFDTLVQVEPIVKPLEIEPVTHKFDSILSFEIQSSGTVGAAVVVTYKDRIALLKCYGVRKIGENDSINEHTIFRLASVSKTLSGTLAGILAEKGIINLDEKVVDFLPEFKLQKNENTHNLTIRHLLSHTSGLIAHSYDNYAEIKFPMQKIIPLLSEAPISAVPGQKYDYQNVMFSLFDTILVKKLNNPFDTILHENLLSPFGMKDASTGFSMFESNQNKAYPHAGANGNYHSIKLNDRYYTTSPAAGINASISDLAQFLLHLTSGNQASIKPEVQNIVFEPQIISPLKQSYLSYWGKVDTKEYALGWRIIGYKGRTVAYHGGYVNGYKTEIAYCDQEDIGIAYLTNSPNSVASLSVPTLLNLLFEFNDSKKLLTETEFSVSTSDEF
jgi:beta-lactamase class C